MDRLALRVFARSVTTNWRNLIATCILYMSSLALSAAFSAILAFYFGFDVFDLSAHPLVAPVAAEPRLLILAAFVAAALSVLVKVLDTLIDARVVFSRELWFARRIRAAAAGAPLSAKTVPRASSHFGRLSAASMNACSAAIILGLNMALLPFLLPPLWAACLLGLIAFCIALSGLFFIGLSRRMQNASIYMTTNAGVVSRWKLMPDVEDPAELALYSQAYSIRIFLSSIFSYAPALLAVLFTVVLFIAAEIGFRFNLGQAFVAFVLAQTYLGLVGKLFNSAIKASAFAPAVAAHADVLLSDAPSGAGSETAVPAATVQERAAAARERDDELLSFGE